MEEKTQEKTGSGKPHPPFEVGNPGGPGFPKGRLNLKLRFHNAVEEISHAKCPAAILSVIQKHFPNAIVEDNARAIAYVTMLNTLNGNLDALDRLIGKPDQKLEHSGNILLESMTNEELAKFILENQGDKSGAE